MSWVEPPVFDENLTLGDFAIIAGDFRYLHRPPVCELTSNSNQDILDSTETALDFQVEIVDTDNMHTTPANEERITIQTAGRFLFSAIVPFSNLALGGRRATIRRGGSDAIAREAFDVAASVSSPTHLNVVDVFRFTAAQYIEAVAFQNSGSTRFAPAGLAHFSAVWLGE